MIHRDTRLGVCLTLDAHCSVWNNGRRHRHGARVRRRSVTWWSRLVICILRIRLFHFLLRRHRWSGPRRLSSSRDDSSGARGVRLIPIGSIRGHRHGTLISVSLWHDPALCSHRGCRSIRLLTKSSGRRMIETTRRGSIGRWSTHPCH